jgi:signal transduction histidine kinase
MLILFAIVSFVVSKSAEDQIKLAIEIKTKLMLHEVETDGMSDLAQMIQKIEPTSRASRFLLLDANKQRIAGSLPVVVASEGWTKITAKRDGDLGAEDTILVLGTRLPDKQSLLLVGQNAALLDEMKTWITKAFAWSTVATFGLAMSFGLVTGFVFLRRVEAVNAAAERIVAGDLRRRLPVHGSNDEFDQLSRNLNRMLDRIEDLIADLQQVSSDIAHDLRTPLSRLQQGLQTARTEARSIDAFQAAVDKALEQTGEILLTFGALLRIAQIDAGVSATEMHDIDLSEICERIQEAYASVAEDDGKTLSGRIEPGVIVRGDRQLLTHMIANLVENAICHTPRRTAIRLELTKDTPGAVCVISDDGPGIPVNAREKVFQRFFRLDQSRSTTGSGLGLSLVAAIAKLHGITITLSDNRPGLRVLLAIGVAQHGRERKVRCVETALLGVEVGEGRTGSAPIMAHPRV